MRVKVVVGLFHDYMEWSEKFFLGMGHLNLKKVRGVLFCEFFGRPFS